MKAETLLQLPVLREVDVLVVGTCSGAVAAALEIRRLGRSSMVIGEMSYFGEESAGTLNLWPESLDMADALVNAMFTGGSSSLPATPCHVKRVLESSLIQASVPFLYLARPVALLRSEDGRLLGAIIAARTSLFVVRCSAVIDATRYGVAGRLAGAELTGRNELPQKLSWIVLSDGVPAGWKNHAEELRPPFRQISADGEKTYGAYRLGIDRSALGSNPLAMEHLVRAFTVSSNVSVTADIIPDIPSVFCATSGLVDNPAKLCDASFSAAPDLFLLNGLLPLSPHGATVLERSDAQVALGRRTGAIAAGSLRKKTDDSGTVNVLTGGEIGGQFRFAPAFLRRTGGVLDIPLRAFPFLGSCDVVVAGGGTGGAPAAISAARAGARTVVLESQHGLGGIGTLGLISGYYFGNQVGFTAELDEAVKQSDADYRSGKSCHWQPGLKSAVYQRMLKEAGGTAWMGSFAFGVRISGRQVDGVLVSTPFGCGLLEAGCVVDATGNADIAAAAGAPCRVIGADHLATQGTGLSPRPAPGVRCYNSDWTFVDETDPEGITAAFVNARAKFADSFDISPMVNSRERRQIIGEYEISPLDILAHRTFPDTVVVARSNFDSHGFTIHPVFMVAEPDHDSSLQAHLPFRCMLPQGIDGVIVTGLGMSAHRDALPVLRMQADVQNQGFAAGLAAAMVVKGTRRLHDLHVRELQRRLVEVGILTPEIAVQEDLFPLPDKAIADAARGALRSPLHAAILFAHPEKSRPLLQSRLKNAQDA
ncbi:MAG: FAD-dependent oxidoreductase, partial [Victivallales bacterium]